MTDSFVLILWRLEGDVLALSGARIPENQHPKNFISNIHVALELKKMFASSVRSIWSSKYMVS